jgi:hypothetical protein
MDIKQQVDEKVLINTQMLNNESYFDKLMIQMVIGSFGKSKIELDPDSAKYINSCLVKEYINEYQGKVRMVTQDFTAQTKELIDNLKGVCTSYGLGNDGNEFKIITQVFLYKFMNDKFGYEVKQLEPKLATAESWEQEIANTPTSNMKCCCCA